MEHLPEALIQKISARLIEDANGCWIWQGAITRNGYGNVVWQGKCYNVHRLTCIAGNGPIPSGYVVDHGCRKRACCNPDHLEAVTHEENMRRRREPVCSRGHPKTPENVMTSPNGHRKCRICHKLRARDHRRRHISSD